MGIHKNSRTECHMLEHLASPTEPCLKPSQLDICNDMDKKIYIISLCLQVFSCSDKGNFFFCTPLCVYVCLKLTAGRQTYVQQEVVLKDPLHWLEQVGAQGQGVPQRFLALAEELRQRLVPHALG